MMNDDFRPNSADADAAADGRGGLAFSLSLYINDVCEVKT
jgi:hypothetical protein